MVAGDQYRVIRRLGAGGFGTVYLVETLVGGLRRALKVLHPEWARDPRGRDRFINEAVVLEQVNHPNIARCYAAGTLEGGAALYLLFELVEGLPLDELLGTRRGGAPTRLDPARAVRIANAVASGLSVAHANGILHRDLKPQNILVARAGESSEHVKLVDFGIATSIEDELTGTRSIVGTPLFMAPEQLRSEPLDRRVDLWQLGAVLFEMLTGRPPFEATSLGELMAAHERAREAGPRPSERVPALAAHPTLDRLVSRLLAADRHRRPRSAVQVCEELARIEHELSGSGRGGPMGLLEALTANPGEGSWWALCRYLSTPAEANEELIAAADALLSDWPDELRRAPLGWWELVRRGEACRLWALVRALDLSGRGLGDDEVALLAECEALRLVSCLALADNEIGNDGVAALAGSPHLAGVRRLDLCRNRLSSAAVESLVGSRFVHLEELSLAGNGLGPRAAEMLARAVFRLRALDLSDNALQAGGAAALAGADVLQRLERLSLRDCELGSDGAGAIATSRSLTALVELDIGYNRIGAAGAAALALSPNMSALRVLRLAGNTLGLQGVELLLGSTRFGALESLDLSSNDLGAQAAMALASSPFARRLTSLDIADNGLGDAGLAALLGAPYLSRVRVLNVADNRLTSAGAALLGGASPDLDTLDMSRNRLGADGAPALAQALRRLRVRDLRLNATGLSGGDAVAILEGAGGTLAAVSLTGNELGMADAEALAASTGLSSITRLDVSGNRLGVEGVEALCGSRWLGNLRELGLRANGLEDTGGEALARAIESLPALEAVWFDDNGLGHRTARALAASPVARRLATLSLASNQLGDAGATALAHGEGWQALRWLDLRQNGIGLAAAATILAAPGTSLLARVNFAQNALAGLVDVHSLARRKVALLEASFARVTDSRADFAERFYRHLFSRHPGVKPLFAHVNMRRQQQHLMVAMTMVIENLRNPELLAEQLVALGERHIDYGVFPSHYQAVTTALVDTIRMMHGEEWNDELEEAWQDGIEAVATTMMTAHRTKPEQPRPHPAGLRMEAKAGWE